MAVYVYYHVWVVRREDQEYREIVGRLRGERRKSSGRSG
jgi:hypothetical protein